LKGGGQSIERWGERVNALEGGGGGVNTVKTLKFEETKVGSA